MSRRPGRLSTYWSPAQLRGVQHSLGEQRSLLMLELHTLQQTQANMARLSTELSLVEQAQARPRRGVFGICINCGEDIPAPRLRLQPAAPRCLACQEAIDVSACLNGKHQSPSPKTL